MRSPVHHHVLLCCLFLVPIVTLDAHGEVQPDASDSSLKWDRLPPLPDELGVAGPFAGVHEGVLLVAGGANFPEPVWESEKAWHDRIYVLVKEGSDFVWHEAGRLPGPRAYGAAVSTPDGVVTLSGPT